MRLNPYALRPDAHRALRSLTQSLAEGLEPELQSLVEYRVSQINGCAFCLAMHSDEARAAGVGQRKLDLAPGWRDSDLFSDRERAALGLAESISLERTVDDETWSTAASVFSETELADLVLLVGMIYLFNKVNIAVQFPAEKWRGH